MPITGPGGRALPAHDHANRADVLRSEIYGLARAQDAYHQANALVATNTSREAGAAREVAVLQVHQAWSRVFEILDHVPRATNKHAD